MKMRLTLILALCTVVASCSANKQFGNAPRQPLGAGNKDSFGAAGEFLEKRFVPDTSIGGKFFLMSPEKALESSSRLKKSASNHESRLIANVKGDQRLVLHLSLGGSAYEYSAFEVSYSNAKGFTDSSVNQVHDILEVCELMQFETESHIKLGMTPAEVVKIKGGSYLETSEGRFRKISYEISHNQEVYAMFLGRYNMPGYELVLYFEKNKLYKFFCGFPVP